MEAVWSARRVARRLGHSDLLSPFQQDNARPHTTKVSKDCLRTTTILPWPARSAVLSPFEHILDHLGQRVGHLMSLNELETRLKQSRTKCLKRHHIELVCLNTRWYRIVHSR
ncbi:transposable element Tcb2 transposase [Trichonephila clavipes]|nr:transposable element Tcb2 transposase [Trichonephila clavipes]